MRAEGFPYDRYFGPEGQELLSALLALFSRRFRKPPRVPLTLGMLEEAMRLGRWEAEAIERMARYRAPHRA